MKKILFLAILVVSTLVKAEKLTIETAKISSLTTTDGKTYYSQAACEGLKKSKEMEELGKPIAQAKVGQVAQAQVGQIGYTSPKFSCERSTTYNGLYELIENREGFPSTFHTSTW